MMLGCHTILFGGFDLAAALRHIAWAGFDAVEIACIAGMAEHVSPDTSEADVREVGQRLGDLGLHLCPLDVADHKLERLRRALPLAAALGAPVVNAVSGGKPGHPDSYRAAIYTLGRAAELASQQGVKLAVKPRLGAAIHDVATARRLLADVRSPWLGLCFDPSHVFRAGEDTVAAAQQLGPHLIAGHVRDCPSREPQPGPPDLQTPGRGKIDLPGTIAALREAGYGGALSLHVVGLVRRGRPHPDFPLSRIMGLAAESRGYLRRCLEAPAASHRQPVAERRK